MNYEDYPMYNEYIDDANTEKLEPCESTYDEEDYKHKKRMIEVEEVLGTGSAETTVEVCIPLCPPAFEILDNLVTKVVEFDAIVATKGKVFINGRVIKDIPYKTKERSCYPSCNRIEKITYGNIKHATAEIPFALCIDVPQAFKGAKVVVLNYDVTSVEIPYHTPCAPKACVSKCEPLPMKLDTCQRKLFRSITEKDCISVTVKVVKESIMNVPNMDEKY